MTRLISSELMEFKKKKIDDEIIAQIDNNDLLTSLDIEDCEIDIESIEKLFQVLKNKQLNNFHIINFSNDSNKYGLTIKLVCELISTSTSINIISLISTFEWDSEISNAFKEALINTKSLKTLCLSDNGEMSTDHAKDIAEGIKLNSTLESLNLNFNNIDDSGIKEIADAFGNNTVLKWLLLEDNKISDKGFKAIIDGLQFNYTLEAIMLIGNAMSFENIDTIESLLSEDQRVDREALSLLRYR